MHRNTLFVTILVCVEWDLERWRTETKAPSLKQWKWFQAATICGLPSSISAFGQNLFSKNIIVEISPLIPESWRAGFILFRHTSCSVGVEVVASAPEPRDASKDQGTKLQRPQFFRLFSTLGGEYHGIPSYQFRTTACPQWPRGAKL